MRKVNMLSMVVLMGTMPLAAACGDNARTPDGAVRAALAAADRGQTDRLVDLIDFERLTLAFYGESVMPTDLEERAALRDEAAEFQEEFFAEFVTPSPGLLEEMGDYVTALYNREDLRRIGSWTNLLGMAIGFDDVQLGEPAVHIEEEDAAIVHLPVTDVGILNAEFSVPIHLERSDREWRIVRLDHYGIAEQVERLQRTRMNEFNSQAREQLAERVEFGEVKRDRSVRTQQINWFEVRRTYDHTFELPITNVSGVPLSGIRAVASVGGREVGFTLDTEIEPGETATLSTRASTRDTGRDRALRGNVGSITAQRAAFRHEEGIEVIDGMVQHWEDLVRYHYRGGEALFPEEEFAIGSFISYGSVPEWGEGW